MNTILKFMIDLGEVKKKYFDSMVVFRISSLISTLTRHQIELLTKSKDMSLKEMDKYLNDLENVKRYIEGKIG